MRILLFLILSALCMNSLYASISVKEDLFIQHFGINQQISCVAYGAQHNIDAYDAHIDKDWVVDIEKVRKDLTYLRKYTSCLRIYTLEFGGKEAVEIAYDLEFDTIYLGIEIWKEREKNLKNIDETLKLASRYPNVKAILLGNELFHHNAAKMMKMTKDHYKSLFDYARQRTPLPIAVSEPISYPMDYFAFSDFISVHAHLYWFKMSPDKVDAFFDKYLARFEKAYPGKKIIISEIGWPKQGITYGDAVPGIENQKLLLNNAIAYLDKRNIPYVFFEAFDQPWKKDLFEGRAGAHWGVFNQDSNTADYKAFYLGLYALSALLLFLLFSRKKIRKGPLTNSVIAICPHVIAFSYIMIILTLQNAYELSFSYSSVVFLAFTMLTFTVVVYRAYMLIEIFGGPSFNIAALQARNAAQMPDTLAAQPFVSVHVPCKDEDPFIVIDCIKSLQNLDYENYEVIVFDNNTSDKSLYQPIADYVAAQGANIRFYHQDGVTGYKAGALNICLEKADTDAEIIAVVDSDYKVSKDWLKDITPYFGNPEVSCVQCPQDFDASGATALQKLLHSEYIGFFKIGMVQRAFRNAIIHHGTMICIRKTALADMGGWPTSTIVEDADLGLSLQKSGKTTLYMPQSYGKGQIPFTHDEYCKQRLRWALGAYQLTAKHWKHLFGFKKGLSASQRTHYLLGYLPWILTAMHPVFLLVVLYQVVFAYISPNSFIHPMFFVPYLIFILSEVLFAVSSYKKRVPLTGKNIALSVFTGASLTFTISKAFWVFLFRKTVPFERTLKTQDKAVKRKFSVKLYSVFNFAALLTLCLTVYLCFKIGAYNREVYVWLLISILFALPSISQMVLSRLGRVKRTDDLHKGQM